MGILSKAAGCSLVVCMIFTGMTCEIVRYAYNDDDDDDDDDDNDNSINDQGVIQNIFLGGSSMKKCDHDCDQALTKSSWGSV